jgi:hypothetical protein
MVNSLVSDGCFRFNLAFLSGRRLKFKFPAALLAPVAAGNGMGSE